MLRLLITFLTLLLLNTNHVYNTHFSNNIYDLKRYIPFSEAEYDIDYFQGEFSFPLNIETIFEPDFVFPPGQGSYSFLLGGTSPLKVVHHKNRTLIYDLNGPSVSYNRHINMDFPIGLYSNLLVFSAFHQLHILDLLQEPANLDFWDFGFDEQMPETNIIFYSLPYDFPGEIYRMFKDKFFVFYSRWSLESIITIFDFYEIEHGQPVFTGSINMEQPSLHSGVYWARPMKDAWLIYGGHEILIVKESKIIGELPLTFKPTRLYCFEDEDGSYITASAYSKQWSLITLDMDNKEGDILKVKGTWNTATIICDISGNSRYIYVPQYDINQNTHIDIFDLLIGDIIGRITIPKEFGACSKVTVNGSNQYAAQCERGVIFGDVNNDIDNYVFGTKGPCSQIDRCGEKLYIETDDGGLYSVALKAD